MGSGRSHPAARLLMSRPGRPRHKVVSSAVPYRPWCGEDTADGGGAEHGAGRPDRPEIAPGRWAGDPRTDGRGRRGQERGCFSCPKEPSLTQASTSWPRVRTVNRLRPTGAARPGMSCVVKRNRSRRWRGNSGCGRSSVPSPRSPRRTGRTTASTSSPNQGCLVARYDKRFLSHTEVSYLYSPGKEPLVFEVDGIRFGCALWGLVPGSWTRVMRLASA
jgi:hypothetical protein